MYSKVDITRDKSTGYYVVSALRLDGIVTQFKYPTLALARRQLIELLYGPSIETVDWT